MTIPQPAHNGTWVHPDPTHTVKSPVQPKICACGKPVHDGTWWVQTQLTRKALRTARETAPHDTGELTRSIRRLAQAPCENFTGAMTCMSPGSGRTPDAEDLAHRYCWPCRIRHAMHEAAAGARREANTHSVTTNPHRKSGLGSGSSRARARRGWLGRASRYFGAWFMECVRGVPYVVSSAAFWLLVLAAAYVMYVVLLLTEVGL